MCNGGRLKDQTDVIFALSLSLSLSLSLADVALIRLVDCLLLQQIDPLLITNSPPSIMTSHHCHNCSNVIQIKCVYLYFLIAMILRFLILRSEYQHLICLKAQNTQNMVYLFSKYTRGRASSESFISLAHPVTSG